MKTISIVFFVALLAGCAASGTQVSEQAATQFKEGVTTEKEIVAKLGRPNGVSLIGGKRFLSYSGVQTKTNAASFIPIVGLFAGGADSQITIATYQIGPTGVLENISYSSSGSSYRMGTNPAEMTSQEPTAIK